MARKKKKNNPSPSREKTRPAEENLELDPEDLAMVKETSDLLEKIAHDLANIGFLESIDELSANLDMTEELCEMSTAEILAELKELGIRTSKAKFLKDSKDYWSAEDFADECWTSEDSHFDVDSEFLTLAAMELWERFSPRRPSIEMLSDQIEENLVLQRVGNSVQCAESTLNIWQGLRTLLADEVDSLEELDDRWTGYHAISEWLVELPERLQEAGKVQTRFFEECLRFCQEVAEIFPNSDPDTLAKLGADEANATIALGKIEEGLQRFEQLCGEYPSSPWPWIYWGNALLIQPEIADLAVAEELYREALPKCNASDRKLVEDRIAELQKDRRRFN